MASLADFTPFISEPAIIEIKDKVVVARHPCGDYGMSVRTLQRLGDRIQRALERHAQGDEIIIVGD